MTKVKLTYKAKDLVAIEKKETKRTARLKFEKTDLNKMSWLQA